MSDHWEQRIASIHMEPATFLDRLIRRAGPYAYVCEFKHPQYHQYGGGHQKRHQRRYADLTGAARRLDYLLATKDVHKAYIMGFPIDVEHYTRKAKQALAVCLQCGSHDWKVDPNAEPTRQDTP